MAQPAEIYDVLIVGLGPTGAVLANILGQYGWSVAGIEREEDLYYAPRAVHFDDEILRVFQSIGLAGEIERTSEAFWGIEMPLTPTGKPMYRTPIGTQDFRYGYRGAYWFHQPTLEQHFHDGMKRYANVVTYLGAEVTAIAQDASGVTVTVRHSDGRTGPLRARYLVGCDGGKSMVRKAAGLTLTSADFEEPWVVVDTKTISGKKDPNLPKEHRQYCNPHQPVTYVPMAGNYYEWQFMVTGGKTEQQATDPYLVRQQLKPFVDLHTIEITRIAYYKFHALWAEKWRNGRLLLAGDAAHQMPPFLGQGMCAGVRDASVLGWRLDLVLRGQATEQLLDTYESERRAHVRHIINGAMFLGSLIQTKKPWVAFLRNNLMFRPAQALPALRKFIYEQANRKRPISHGLLGQRRPKLVGHLAIQPKVSPATGAPVLLDEVLGLGFAVLARASAAPALRAQLARQPLPVVCRLVAFAPTSTPAAEAVGDTDGRLADWFAEHGVDFVLIRPDRYVYDGGKVTDFATIAADFTRQFPAVAHLQPAVA